MLVVEIFVLILRVVVGVVVLDTVLVNVCTDKVKLRQLTAQLTAPIYYPIRLIFDPDEMGVDVSPAVVVGAAILTAFSLAPHLVA